MTRLFHDVVELLSPAVPQPATATVEADPIAATQLTRGEMERLFFRELGRGRFH